MSMSDSAKGPAAGYIYQFEKALFQLSNLTDSNDYISIEDVDDIASHQADGTVLIADQAKHSISSSGSTFGSTSYSLWRTIEIWILKLENKTFNSKTKFICSTNKKVPSSSLLYFMSINNIDDVINNIEELLKGQQEKLKKIKDEKKSGKSVSKIITLIKFSLKNKESLKLIIQNLTIEDNDSLKESIFNNLHLNSKKYNKTQKDTIYESLLGWVINNSYYRWKQGEEAIIYKSDFDQKYQSTIIRPSLISSIFRPKESLGNIDDNSINQKKEELFVQQINVIKRRAKEEIIKNAIIDFIRYEIEHTYMINEIGDFTKEDFEKYLDICQEEWQKYFNSTVTLEFDEYTDDEKNKLAIKIYDYVMNSLQINFSEDYLITNSREYIKNGSFLKLSNIPRVGWHPEWEEKFNKN